MKDRRSKHTYDLKIKDIKSYFRIHRYGLLLNGRLSIGLERMVMQLLELQNVRQISTFPRDAHRLET
ncbi:MAG: hypothetical protein J6F30_06110 [Cellulosilyticum sp.]|nr:hypothetical protein [Cellulosilyticum sp.]MBP3911949.1 hypothetical protein [Niameybacter sp.]